MQIVDKMYITEVDLNIEDGDTFFPEFDINDFDFDKFGEDETLGIGVNLDLGYFHKYITFMHIYCCKTNSS